MADRKLQDDQRSRGRGVTHFLRGVTVILGSFFALSLVLTLHQPSSAQVERGASEPDNPMLFRQIEYLLGRSYLDLSRIQPRPLLHKALSALELSADEIYVENSDPDSPTVPLHVGDKTQVFDLGRVETREQMVDILERVFAFLKENYRGDASLNDLRYAAANGYLSGIDPHTVIFTPKDFEEFEVHIRGHIYGVGMLVGQTEDGKLEVKKVLDDTPAFRAGFKKADLIAKIDDESTINMTVMEAVQKIRGPKNSEVVLTVKRNAPDDEVQTLPIPVKRDLVRIKSVESQLIMSKTAQGKPRSTGIGYAKVRTFDQNTANSLLEHLADLKTANGDKPLRGLVLDLRDNSGGLLTQAIEMCDAFLRSGDIVCTARKDEDLTYDRAKNDGFEPDCPIVCLSNEGSASGAEIVIGALQKNDRALVLGTSTFGKGSVQQLQGLPSGAQLKITVSEYLIPDRTSIQETGVIPQILADAVTIEPDQHDVYSDRKAWTEKDYEAHLISRYKRDEKPRYEIKYIAEVESDEEDEDDAKKESETERFISGDLEPEKDRLVQMALKVLALADSPYEPPLKPSEVLERRTAEIEALRSEYYEEIVARLEEKLKVDWSASPAQIATTAPSLKIDLSQEFIAEPAKDKEDKVPVKKLLVRARVTNQGDAPLYRVKGLTSSDSALYRDKEFLFGKLEPGKTIEVAEKFRLPYFPFAQNDQLTLELSSEDGKVLASPSMEVALEPEPRPSFAYSARLENQKKEPIQLLGPGMQTSMVLEIHNAGKGPAHKGVAILRNKTGRQVFLEKGRLEFSDLGPGEKTEVVFQFRVRSGKPVEAYEFELMIYEMYSDQSLTRKLKIGKVGTTGNEFPNGVRFQPPEIDLTLVQAGAANNVLATEKEAVEVKAFLESGDKSFRTWVTHLPVTPRHKIPDKVFFADSEGRTSFAFSTMVRLAAGSNLVTVVAKDRDGLESRQSFMVRRK